MSDGHAHRSAAAARVGAVARAARIAAVIGTAALCLAPATPAVAGTADGQTGAFAPIAVGARALGMAGAVCALDHGAWATYWNPANLFDLAHPELAVDYADLFGLGIARHTALAFAWRTEPKQNVIRGDRVVEVPRAGGILGWGVSLGVTRVDLEPETYTEITPALSVAGQPWSAVTFGGTFRILRASSDLDEVSAIGLAIDLGLTTARLPGLTAALTVRNLVSTISWADDTTDTLPIELTAGAASTRFAPFTIAADVTGASDIPFRVARLGGEWAHPSGLLALRAGLAWHEDRGDDQLGLTFGAGTGFAGVRADYAFVGEDEALGDTHRVSLSLRF